LAELFERTNRIETFMGIDPGVSGSIAVIDRSLNIKLLTDWPGDEIMAADIIRALKDRYQKNIHAALEKAQSMPQQGVRSTFVYGTNYGIWKGILAAFKVPFLEPTPQAWQKGVLKKAQDKKPAIAAAHRIFPSAAITGPRGGMIHGRADALLIADWCRRQYI